ncbi:hypothetical protein WS95_04105 [Burkholderia sp. MSMB1826]|nr:hypothetical protein WS95_04105 [Burkholderia sp. MSMB1826]
MHRTGIVLWLGTLRHWIAKTIATTLCVAIVFVSMMTGSMRVMRAPSPGLRLLIGSVPCQLLEHLLQLCFDLPDRGICRWVSGMFRIKVTQVADQCRDVLTEAIGIHHVSFST